MIDIFAKVAINVFKLFEPPSAYTCKSMRFLTVTSVHKNSKIEKAKWMNHNHQTTINEWIIYRYKYQQSSIIYVCRYSYSVKNSIPTDSGPKHMEYTKYMHAWLEKWCSIDERWLTNERTDWLSYVNVWWVSVNALVSMFQKKYKLSGIWQ